MDFSKPVNELSVDDLKGLLGAAEGDRLEYKRDAYLRNDEDTREILRDVCSLMVRVLSLSIGVLLLPGLGFGQQQGPMRPFPFMQDMEQPFRELRAQIKDPTQNASSIDLIRRIEREALSAKNAVPPIIESLPPKQYEARLLAYRKLMLKLIKEALLLEEHLLEGDNVKARAALIAMIETRRTGHQTFTKSGPVD